MDGYERGLGGNSGGGGGGSSFGFGTSNQMGINTAANRSSQSAGLSGSRNMSSSEIEDAAYAARMLGLAYSGNFTGGRNDGSSVVQNSAPSSLLTSSERQPQSFHMDQRPIMQMSSTSFPDKGDRAKGGRDDFSTDDWMNHSQRDTNSFSAESSYQRSPRGSNDNWEPPRGNDNWNSQKFQSGSDRRGNQDHDNNMISGDDGRQGEGGRVRQNNRKRSKQNKKTHNQTANIVQANQVQQLQLQQTLNRLKKLEDAQKKKDLQMQQMEQMLRKRKLDDEMTSLRMEVNRKKKRQQEHQQHFSGRPNLPRGSFFNTEPVPLMDLYSGASMHGGFPLALFGGDTIGTGVSHGGRTGTGVSRGGGRTGTGVSRGGADKGGVKRLTPSAQVGQNKELTENRKTRKQKNRRRKRSTGQQQPNANVTQQQQNNGGQQQGGHSSDQKKIGKSSGQQQSSGSSGQQGSHTERQQLQSSSGVNKPSIGGVSQQQAGLSGNQQQQKTTPKSKRQKKKEKAQQVNSGGKTSNQNTGKASQNQDKANTDKPATFRTDTDALNQLAIRMLPMELVTDGTYSRSDLEKAFYQEMNKITDHVLQTPVPPSKKMVAKLMSTERGPNDKLCVGCNQIGHMVLDCTDKDVKDQLEKEKKAVGSTTAKHQINILAHIQLFKEHIYDRKIYNLHCYTCGIKANSLTDYNQHLETENHKQNARDVFGSKVGNPKRIPLVFRLHKLPLVQSKTEEKQEATTQAKAEKEVENYSFFCRVCNATCAGPWEEHCVSSLLHKHHIENDPRCTRCRLYNNSYKTHFKTWLHKRITTLKERIDTKLAANEGHIEQLVVQSLVEETPKEPSISGKNDQDKPTAQDKPAMKQDDAPKLKTCIPPGTIIGMKYMLPLTGWYCSACKKFCPNVSKEAHCSEEEHHIKVMQFCARGNISIDALLKTCLPKDKPTVKPNPSSDEVKEDAGTKEDIVMENTTVDKITEGGEDEDVDIEGGDEKVANHGGVASQGDGENAHGEEYCDEIEEEEGILEDAPATLEDDIKDNGENEDVPTALVGVEKENKGLPSALVESDNDNGGNEKMQVDEEAKPVGDEVKDAVDENEKIEEVKEVTVMMKETIVPVSGATDEEAVPENEPQTEKIEDEKEVKDDLEVKMEETNVPEPGATKEAVPKNEPKTVEETTPPAKTTPRRVSSRIK